MLITLGLTCVKRGSFLRMVFSENKYKFSAPTQDVEMQSTIYDKHCLIKHDIRGFELGLR